MKRSAEAGKRPIMKKNYIWVSTLREIRGSLGRFMAILAIVALGVGFFAGLKVTRAAMVETTQQYLENNVFYDYRLLSTLGFEEEDVFFLTEQEEVLAAEGSITADILYKTEDDRSGVVKAHMLTEKVNYIKVLEGRMPATAAECVVDANLFAGSRLGETLFLSENNEQEDLDIFAGREYTIVGIVQSPSYLQYERGNTSLGNGRVDGFIYLPAEGFDADYYTEIFVKFTKDFNLYSQEYEDYLAEKEMVWERLTEEAGTARYQRLLAEAEEEITEGREELAREKEEAWEELADAKKELEKAEKELADAAEEIADGKREIADGRKELEDGRKELAEKEQELNDAKIKLAEGEQEIADGEKELADALEEWEVENEKAEDGEKQLLEAQTLLAAQKAELTAKEEALAAGEADLAAGQATLDEQKKQAEGAVAAGRAELDAQEAGLQTAFDAGFLTQAEYDAGMAAIAAGRTQLEEGWTQAENQFVQAQDKIDASKQELEAGRKALEEGRQILAAYQTEVNEGIAQVHAGQSALASAYMEIQGAEAELRRGKQELEDAKAEIADGEIQIADAKKKIADGIRELADAEEELAKGEQEYQDGLLEYEDGLKEYQEGLEEFETEIADAEAEIAEAEEELADLEAPDTYVLGRDTNVGYVCFESDSAIVDGIANIFPVFFFLVAALVCGTTMNRMVEEQRTQIGVLKALGYGKGLIMSKYLFYAGTAALAGCFAGFFGGTWLFPRVIWSAYGIMYRVEPLIYVFSPVLGAVSLTASLLCTMGTTYLTCRYELSQVAAELMRPKAPKAGKRVFLERIPFIWSRMSFLIKVSVRNIFRYKKRLLMMVIGISGCTALLVTGFGVKDSIAHIATQQFSEIQIYDLGISLSDPVTEAFEEKLQEVLGEGLEGSFSLQETTIDLVKDDKAKSINLVTADAGQDITPYLNLHTQSREAIAYPGEGEVVVTAKVAEELGISLGDTVFLQDEDRNAITVKVTGINRNFIYNYAYISADTYAAQTGEAPVYKSLWVNLCEDADLYQTSASLMQLEQVANITINKDMQERFTSMMASLDLIVAFIILCAGGLAFIVLYNLTNINITERVREIATIKVLGFFKSETAAYVFRENAVLTLMGALVGLPLGCLLHRFVMDRVRIDMVAFDTLVTPLSYLLSTLLTLAFAWLINLFMRGKLNKISMTESLKSVD